MNMTINQGPYQYKAKPHRLRGPPSRETLLKLLETHTPKQISAKYGLKPNTIYRWLKRRKIKRGNRGEEHYITKLTPDDIRLIRALYTDGIFQKEIAAKFEICQPVVSDIVNFVTWKHVR